MDPGGVRLAESPPSSGESGANLIFGGESHRWPSGISPTPTQRCFSASLSSMSSQSERACGLARPGGCAEA